MSDEYFTATPEAAQTAGTTAPVWELSGWWRRVGASIIDGLILWIPISVLVELSGLAPDPVPGDYSISANIDLAGMIVYIVASAAYFMTTMTAWNGQTVGKKVTGIRVVREDGQRVDPKFAFTRQTLVMGILFGWLAAVLLWIPTFLNYLWPLWDDKNQALHDKIVKSRVVLSAEVAETGVAVPPAPPAPAGQPVYGYTTPSPQEPAVESPAPPAASAPIPPPPPPPSGTSTPYTPPPGFENPVPEEEK